jgi:hypothetical protein
MSALFQFGHHFFANTQNTRSNVLNLGLGLSRLKNGELLAQGQDFENKIATRAEKTKNGCTEQPEQEEHRSES